MLNEILSLLLKYDEVEGIPHWHEGLRKLVAEHIVPFTRYFELAHYDYILGTLYI